MGNAVALGVICTETPEADCRGMMGDGACSMAAAGSGSGGRRGMMGNEACSMAAARRESNESCK